MSKNSDLINLVENSVKNCQKFESKILLGQTQLVLSTKLLNYLLETHDDNNQVNYMKQLIRRSPAVKIIGEGIVMAQQIGCFESCSSLELHRIPFDQLIGLDKLKPKLKSFAGQKSISRFKDLNEHFWDVFGVWPSLSTLKLSENNIQSINASILPSTIKSLDLSWNKIAHFNNTADYCHNSLERLDLKFNSMISMPKLNLSTRNSLKCLYLRRNLLENIDGIEQLIQLTEFDVAFNCLIDAKSFLSQIERCKNLKKLWIEGNPFCFDKNVELTIKNQLKCLSDFNGTNLTPNKMTGNQLLKQENVDEGFMSQSNDNLSDDLKSDDFDEKKIVNNVKRKKRRIAVIHDHNEFTLNHSNSNNSIESTQNQMSDLIKEKRQNYGSEWLVSMEPTHRVEGDQRLLALTGQHSIDFSEQQTSSIASFDTNNFSISPPEHESTPKTEHQKQQKHSFDDDIEVINESNEQSEIHWSKEELENGENIYLVDCLSDETDFEVVFLYVREDLMIFEKNVLNGKIVKSHDLSVLIESTDFNDDSTLKLLFDTRIKSKQEVIYKFDCAETKQKFKELFIIPSIRSNQRRNNHSKQTNYECLKCGLNKISQINVICCPNCQSDAMMRTERDSSTQRRRSGSDITILTEQFTHNLMLNQQQNVQLENDLWDEIQLKNDQIDYSLFTKLDHRLKLHFEMQILDENNSNDEIIEGAIECKLMMHDQESGNRFENCFLLLTNKKFYFCLINSNSTGNLMDSKSCDFQIDKKTISKSFFDLKSIKSLPSRLFHQGLWFEWINHDNNPTAKQTQDTNKLSSSLKNSFFSRSSFSKRRNSKLNDDSLTSWNLILFNDEPIGNLFIKFLNSILTKSNLNIKTISNDNKIVFDDSTYTKLIEDQILNVTLLNSISYKINKRETIELPTTEQSIGLIIANNCIHISELVFHQNKDCFVRILYKELMINLTSLSINVELFQMKITFSDDEQNESEIFIKLSSLKTMKSLIQTIKTQWEESFDVPLQIQTLN